MSSTSPILEDGTVCKKEMLVRFQIDGSIRSI